MKHKVSILLGDVYLKRKLELILSDMAVFTDESCADLIFTDSAPFSDDTRVITVGRGEEYTLAPPFSDSDVKALLPSRDRSERGISVIGRRVFFGEKEIKLTELEAALFMKLFNAQGEFVSRDELFSVFSEGSSESMLNVYIHYLREKIELDGSRVILASRKHGYKIDEKFLIKEGV